MDEHVFTSLEDRRKAYADRAGIPLEEARAELLLGSGRTYHLDRVIETGSGWVHIDVREIDDDTIVHSLVLPYYQITHVLMKRLKTKIPQAGFTR